MDFIITMNFLAHIFLSGESPQTMTGGFIGDFVKGDEYKNYPSEIRKGIILHRHIDSFTDNNEIYRESKKRFEPVYRRYAGIVTDIFFDHFLSANWEKYSNFPLPVYIKMIHNTLFFYRDVMPEWTKRVFPSLIYNNYLSMYSSFYGLEKVLNRMSNRTSLPSLTKAGLEILKSQYPEINREFLEFFDELQCYAEKQRNTISE